VDPGAAAVAVIYPLHTGELGGWLLETAVALGGLVLAGLGISGLWLWWKRRQAVSGPRRPWQRRACGRRAELTELSSAIAMGSPPLPWSCAHHSDSLQTRPSAYPDGRCLQA
jgi:uncharacterized iron-regulated membrane protein